VTARGVVPDRVEDGVHAVTRQPAYLWTTSAESSPNRERPLRFE
jgi:hypothetical protein